MEQKKKAVFEKKEISMAKEVSVSRDMGMSKEMSMNGGGGHLYIQTNEVRNCIIHYRRAANGTLTEVERVATGGAGSGTYKPIRGQASAPNSFEGAAGSHPPPVKVRLRSSSHQITSFCLPQTAGTIRFPASPWVTREVSHQSTPSRPGTLSKERAALPNRWHILRPRACFTWSTLSDPIISGSCRSPVMASLRRAWSDTRRIHRRNHTVFQLWVCFHRMRDFSLSAPRSMCLSPSLAPIRTVHRFSGYLVQRENQCPSL